MSNKGTAKSFRDVVAALEENMVDVNITNKETVEVIRDVLIALENVSNLLVAGKVILADRKLTSINHKLNALGVKLLSSIGAENENNSDS